MANDEFDLLRNGPVPTPRDAARERALDAALGDPAWREAARARNLRVIAERGDWDVNMGRIEALFGRLAAGSALGRPGREPAVGPA